VKREKRAAKSPTTKREQADRRAAKRNKPLDLEGVAGTRNHK
jgi:hypothetical protein